MFDNVKLMLHVQTSMAHKEIKTVISHKKLHPVAEWNYLCQKMTENLMQNIKIVMQTIIPRRTTLLCNVYRGEQHKDYPCRLYHKGLG